LEGNCGVGVVGFYIAASGDLVTVNSKTQIVSTSVLRGV